jgi:hypothetical protein
MRKNDDKIKGNIIKKYKKLIIYEYYFMFYELQRILEGEDFLVYYYDKMGKVKEKKSLFELNDLKFGFITKLAIWDNLKVWNILKFMDDFWVKGWKNILFIIDMRREYLFGDLKSFHIFLYKYLVVRVIYFVIYLLRRFIKRIKFFLRYLLFVELFKLFKLYGQYEIERICSIMMIELHIKNCFKLWV